MPWHVLYLSIFVLFCIVLIYPQVVLLTKLHKGLSASDIGRYKLNRICFADKFASYLPAGFMDRAAFAYEAIAIREGRLTMMNRDFSRADVDEIIAYLVTWLLYVFHSIFFFFFLCVCVCTCVCVYVLRVRFL